MASQVLYCQLDRRAPLVVSARSQRELMVNVCDIHRLFIRSSSPCVLQDGEIEVTQLADDVKKFGPLNYLCQQCAQSEAVTGRPVA